MRSVSLRLCDLQKSVIPIGYVDENLHTQVRFDCKKIFEEYPSAIPSLAVCPPAGETYPAIVTREGDFVIWDVTASDVTEDGSGEIQLTFVEDEVVAKSYVCRIRVNRSLEASATAPEPIENWVTRANIVLAEIPQTIAESIDEAFGAITAEASTLTPGSQATASFDSETKVLSIGVPEGLSGEDGYSPVRGVDYWTAADQQAMREDIATDLADAQAAIAGDKADALTAIGSAGTTQVGNVNTAGNTQVGNVNTAGTTQVGLVQAKGADVIASIPSDYSELSDDVSNLKNHVDDLEDALNHGSVVSDTAISLLDTIGNYIAFTSPEAGSLWSDLISELQNPTVTTRYSITLSGSNFISSNPSSYAVEGRNYETTISPETDYVLSSVTATHGSTSVQPIDNDDGTYTIQISDVSANIVITVVAQQDPSSLIYHVENLVLDGTQEPIETPLEFNSNDANGVTEAWTLCARATGVSNLPAYCYVFSTRANNVRLAWDSYTASSASRVKIVGAGNTMDIGSLKNTQSAVVITHEAGSASDLTVHYIDRTTGEYDSYTYSGGGVNVLSYNNGATPLIIGTDHNGNNGFVGEINDITIYHSVKSLSDIMAYLNGGDE